MKIIYLVRHAKSSRQYDVEDHQRPLNDRGLQDAPLMAKYIHEKIELPQLVMSSDAVRAKTTALLYLKELGIPEEELKLETRLYDFNGSQLDKVIKSCPDSIDRLMLFGHNNALTYWVNRYGDQEIDNVATAAFTAISFKTDSWSEIKQGKTLLYVQPKQLK